MASAVRRVLLVEGINDLHTINHLVRHHIPTWPTDRTPPPVSIIQLGGIDAILSPLGLRTRLKNSDWDILGVIVDADRDPADRWTVFRPICAEAFPSIPESLPAGGIIEAAADGKRFGFWLMPDCTAPGMLETFLQSLVPNDAQSLWRHAEAAFDHARAMGAPCRDAHHDKARIHTWLAWQDPPGEPFGRAITRGILDPTAPTATPFITWFKTLYGL